MVYLDDLVKAGQKVEIVRTVTIRYNLDFSEYLDESEITEMSVEELQKDIEDMTDIRSVMDEMDNYEVSADVVEITHIH